MSGGKVARREGRGQRNEIREGRGGKEGEGKESTALDRRGRGWGGKGSTKVAAEGREEVNGGRCKREGIGRSQQR